jgi:acetyltransferase-like isoleucine patch superfamily enzyme
MSASDVLATAYARLVWALGRLWGILQLQLKCRLLGVRVGRGVRLFGGMSVVRYPGSRIVIGDDATLVSQSSRSSFSSVKQKIWMRTHSKSASISIGESSGLTGTSIVARSTSVTIGERVMLGPNCLIADCDGHSVWPPETRAGDSGRSTDAPVVIEDDAWVGADCAILKGVTIGKGSVVALGSIVTRDVEPNSLVAGVPARRVRMLS